METQESTNSRLQAPGGSRQIWVREAGNLVSTAAVECTRLQKKKKSKTKDKLLHHYVDESSLFAHFPQTKTKKTLIQVCC